MTAKSKSETFLAYDQGGFAYAVYDYNRTWNTQNKPWRKPLTFHFDCMRNTKHLDYSPDGGHGMVFPPRFWYDQNAVNNSYSRLTNAIGDQSSWGENLAEAHQSLDLLTHAAGTLTKAATQLRTGNIFACAKTLGMGDLSNKQQRGIRKAKNFGDRWLEYHFGAEPLYQDIHSSLQTLSNTDFGSRTIEGASTARDRNTDRRFQYNADGTLQSTEIIHTTNQYSIKQKMRIRVDNPNAFLANQFGVVNPLTVAWNLTPYSFVVDWFSNVSQCLNAMTDFVGLTIEDAYFTTFSRNTLDYAIYWTDDHHDFVYSNTGIDCTRHTGYAGPSLAVKPFKGFSLTRGITAISLLLQKL